MNIARLCARQKRQEFLCVAKTLQPVKCGLVVARRGFFHRQEKPRWFVFSPGAECPVIKGCLLFYLQTQILL